MDRERIAPSTFTDHPKRIISPVLMHVAHPKCGDLGVP
jgi:hypothetical protein